MPGKTSGEITPVANESDARSKAPKGKKQKDANCFRDTILLLGRNTIEAEKNNAIVAKKTTPSGRMSTDKQLKKPATREGPQLDSFSA